MADSKDDSQVVIGESTWSPEFIQELLPSAERTALLYHLSFLSLGGFPELERPIRDQAIETQMLFGTSEAVLMKCVGTSSNLVTSLFPILIKAVEKNKPVLAVMYLEKARTWIDDIIRAVEDMVMRYDKQTQSVATCTSKMFQKQIETEEEKIKQTKEMKDLVDDLEKLEVELSVNKDKMKAIEQQIIKKQDELRDRISRYSEHKRWIFHAIFPFYSDNLNLPGINAVRDELSRLDSEKNSLRNQEWNIKIKQTDLQLKLANCKIQQGVIPSPVHLIEVQCCLDQIRQILVDLKKFWEKVAVTLDSVKEKTFVGDKLIEYLDDMKEEFLQSIEKAGKYWQRFGGCCQRAHGIFSIQSKDAYKFLEVNPSSLSEEERKRQYESIMEKLRKINPQVSIRAAIQ